MPALTVVTVTLNDLPGLRATRESLGRMRGVDWEHVVVDGGSTDGTVRYLEELGEGARWSSGRDLGPYDAMNKGAAAARGRWVMFLNSGDTLADPGAPARLLRAAEFPGVGMAYGDHLFQGELRRARSLECLHASLLDGDARAWLWGHPCHQSVIGRSSLLREHPFDLRFRVAADYHWMERARQAGYRSVYVPGPVADFQPGGLSSRLHLRCLAEWLRIARMAAGGTPVDRDLFLRWARRHIRKQARRRLLERIRRWTGLGDG